MFLKQLICYKKDEKCTGDVAYSFFEWKLFSSIKVSLSDLYIICSKATWLTSFSFERYMLNQRGVRFKLSESVWPAYLFI